MKVARETERRPEFIHRLDDIVEFDSLTREQIGAIVDLQVAGVVRRVGELLLERAPAVAAAA
jgi:ATP-dependent Clp protease ATP-binding subunit ClpA